MIETIRAYKFEPGNYLIEVNIAEVSEESLNLLRREFLDHGVDITFVTTVSGNALRPIEAIATGSAINSKYIGELRRKRVSAPPQS
jgi:hypothetical protein